MLESVLRRQSREIAKARAETRASLEDPRVALTGESMSYLLDGPPTTSGTRINEKSAIGIVAVLACIRIIAETVASLPLCVYERLQPRGKRSADEHPLYQVLHDRPNPEMPAMVFREMLQAHLLVWGAAFAEIEMNAAGMVTALWPLLPDRTRVQRIDGERVYETQLPNGAWQHIPTDRMFHIQGWSSDGLNSYRPVQLAKNSLGLTSAVEEYGAQFFRNGATMSGVVEHPKVLSKPASDNLRASLERQHTGLSNQHRIMILEEGMKWQGLSIPPNNAQFLETRKFQITDVARLFRVPPHMLADLERATFSNIEQQSTDFIIHTIRPWLVRWEQTINWDLFGSRERSKFFAEHEIKGLLRGDMAARSAFYTSMRNIGVYSANDIRELENDNPIEGEAGDVYLVQGAMIPADQAGKQQQQPADKPQQGDNAAPAEDPTQQDQPTSDTQRSAFAALFRRIGQQMVTREVARLRKAAKHGEATWSQGVEAIYREHCEVFTSEVGTLLAGLLAFSPQFRSVTRAANGLADELVSAELTESRKAIDAAGFAGVEALLATWEKDRAEAFAQRGADYLAGLLETNATVRAA